MLLTRAPVMMLVLLTICLMAISTSAVFHKCCRSYTKQKIPFHVIRGFSFQNATQMCSIDAIIFHTRRGKACTNPAHAWVMDYIIKLRETAAKIHRTASKPS